MLFSVNSNVVRGHFFNYDLFYLMVIEYKKQVEHCDKTKIKLKKNPFKTNNKNASSKRF